MIYDEVVFICLSFIQTCHYFLRTWYIVTLVGRSIHKPVPLTSCTKVEEVIYTSYPWLSYYYVGIWYLSYCWYYYDYYNRLIDGLCCPPVDNI